MSFCIIFVCFIVHFIVHAAFVRMKLMTTTMVIAARRTAARRRVTAGQTDRRHAALEIDLFLLGFISACATLHCRVLVFIVVYTMRDVMSSEALCYYCAGAIASGHLHSPSYLFESSMLSIAVR